MNLKSEDVERTCTEVYTFSSLGLKYGGDFPELAKLLISSPTFMSHTLVCHLMAGFENQKLSELAERMKASGNLPTFDEVTKVVVDSGIAEHYMVAVYVGIKIGRLLEQRDQLNKMMQGGEGDNKS